MRAREILAGCRITWLETAGASDMPSRNPLETGDMVAWAVVLLEVSLHSLEAGILALRRPLEAPVLIVLLHPAVEDEQAPGLLVGVDAVVAALGQDFGAGQALTGSLEESRLLT